MAKKNKCNKRKNKKTFGKAARVFFAAACCFCAVCSVYVLGVDAYVVGSTKSRIITAEAAANIENADCVLVLGCLVKSNGMPSDMLADRLKTGVSLYNTGAAPKLLMSGDHGRIEYNEVGTMKQYAVDLGIPSEDVFMDHAGFSTYDSLYRAKEIFGVDKVIIVTQKYHLHRALHIAESLGIEAYGVPADLHIYRGQAVRDLREVLARNKDFVISALKPEAAILGSAICINGSGDVTNY